MLNLKRHVLRFFWCTAIVGRACRALRRLLSKPSNQLLLLLSLLRLFNTCGKTYAKIISKEIYLRILFHFLFTRDVRFDCSPRFNDLEPEMQETELVAQHIFSNLDSTSFFKTIVETTKELNVIKHILTETLLFHYWSTEPIHHLVIFFL